MKAITLESYACGAGFSTGFASSIDTENPVCAREICATSYKLLAVA
jgi:hypothetical protein